MKTRTNREAWHWLEPPTTPAEQMRSLVRALLVERFKLTTHMEKREQQFYALVVAKGDRKTGPGLRPGTENCNAARARGATSGRGARALGRPPPCATRLGPSQFLAVGVPMGRLTDRLASVLGRVVVDRTGLPGEFDIDLRYRPDAFPATSGDDRPSLFTALRERFGLDLESQRGPVDVLVIERAEQPTND